MDSKSDPSHLVAIGAAGVVLSAAGFYFGTGLRPVWWITWIAAVPVLLAATRLSARAALAAAGLSWLIGELNLWHYLHGQLGIPVGVCAALLAAPALVFAFDVLLFRSLLRRGATCQAALSFPAVWVAWEYALSSFSPHSTFGSLAYSQMDCLPVLQLASVTGLWGILFCLLVLPAAVAVAACGGRPEWRGTGALAAVCVLLAGVFGFGYWRLHEPLGAARSVRVGLVASDVPRNIMVQDREGALRLAREYSVQAAAPAERGAEVIVMPEKTAVVKDSYRDSVDAVMQAAANRTGATIVLGVVDITAASAWNEARIYSPGRAAPRTYAKHHMLPAFESSLAAGTARLVLRQPSGRWGVTICKDMDFPLLSREYGGDGTGLLLVPAWDFTADGWLHGRMAILRGVEDGFSIARAPELGILTLSDDRGRVLAEQDTRSAPFATLLGSVPVRHDDTFYGRFGDWFAWLSIAGLLAGLGRAAWRKRLRMRAA